MAAFLTLSFAWLHGLTTFAAALAPLCLHRPGAVPTAYSRSQFHLLFCGLQALPSRLAHFFPYPTVHFSSLFRQTFLQSTQYSQKS